jgi:hypothetical protein
MQNLNQRTVNNLVKGLITEAGELTFPEGASIDELNCSLDRDGSRSKRLGLNFEPGYSLSQFTVDPAEELHVGEWISPGGISKLTFMVVQTGSVLRFYNSANAPYSTGYDPLALNVNLSAYSAPGKDAKDYRFEFASIAGVLVVVSEGLNTVYLTYDGSSITVSEIEFRVRDFEWISDTCDLTEFIADADITNRRKYDTLNSGWIGNSGTSLETYNGFTVPSGSGLAALKTYRSARGGYPPLTHPWYSGLDSSGNFSLTEWDKVYSGSSLLGNGHFVLDFFNKDRNTAAGITGIATEVENSRFTSVAAYAGRMFYAGLGSGSNAGKILYSRIVETIKESSDCTIIGDCFQQNDPVSDYFSDLLETDGGVINIPDAYNIKKLYTHNQYLYVFADNGVWVISGPDSRFSATSYYVSKVSNVGIFSPGSFVSAEGVPFWWSKYGIHTFAYDETSGFPMEQNLSISTIQKFWDAIGTNGKDKVTSVYDRVNKQIFWFYPNSDEELVNRKTRILILDVSLQAFYPWEISASDTYAVAGFFFDAYGSTTFNDLVVDSLGDTVTDDSSANVFIAGYSLIENANNRIGFITYVPSEDFPGFGNITISTFNSKEFYDWGNMQYETFVECGYDFAGDLLLKKSAPYITTFCRTTEEGYGPAPDYNVINPSGLFVEAYWDFKDYASTRQQIYRVKPSPVFNPLDLTDNGQRKSVVTSRLKIRGSGRSLRLKFVGEEGKNFVLLGYSVLVGSNARF